MLDASAFRNKLQETRRALRADFEWYPYDTLSGLAHLDRMLTGHHRTLLSSQGHGRRVLDIGSADGDLSFFLESLGYHVTALDHPAYNHNGMRGIWALKAALGSAVEICEVDVDRQFTLPHDSYDLVFFLGTLYHLRSPLYALEELARRTSHCFLSTKIARLLPDGKPMPPGMPLAYLVGEDELNRDNSNYFIFSEAALRIALARSHWEIREYMTVGDARSDPVRLDRDERVFCLLESRYDRLANLELLTGWHESEETGWRWTARAFSARLAANGAARERVLHMQVYVAPELAPLTLSISGNGVPLAPAVFAAPGLHSITRSLASGNDFELRFETSRTLQPDADDDRERGIIVASIRVE
jgi:tRNA (mo5U34)-methyltransferase